MASDLERLESFAAVRRPVREAESLPPACYTEAAFHAREVANVFRRAWNFIAHEDEIAAPGDYVCRELAGVALILVRGRDGVVRAFANTCRHRGSRLVAGRGRARAFTCPYHGWTYALDGRLTGAPQMEHAANFRKADYGLHPVRLERWGRFLFVSFDGAAPGLAEQLGELVPLLAPYNFEDLVLVRRREFEIGCNWKGYCENLMEPYHTPVVHAAGMAHKNEDRGAAMLSGNAREVFGGGGPGAPVQLTFGTNYAAIVSRHKGSRGLLPGARPFPAIRTLDARTTAGSIWAYVFPATVFSCQREGMWFNQVLPRGPGGITLAIGSCFRPRPWPVPISPIGSRPTTSAWT